MSHFLLPLVRGGSLAVGRAISVAEVRSWVDGFTGFSAATSGFDAAERAAAVDLSLARARALGRLVPDTLAPTLDEATFRLGAAVHNLLAMTHPRVAQDGHQGAARRVERIAAVTFDIAALGPPRSMNEALTRHSLLARISDVIRQDHTVRDRLGKRVFLGQRPRTRALGLPFRRVPAATSIESARRSWLRDIGVPAAARATFVALNEASPLGEALDPLRLDPPPSWGRLLSVLHFPVLCRAVAGRMRDLGLPQVGDALTEALYRFASLQETSAAASQASEPSIAFAIRFLSHLVWLEVLFERPTAGGDGGGRDASAVRAARLAPAARVRSSTLRASNVSPVGSPIATAGRELAVLLAAAAEIDRGLIWPRDVPPQSDLGLRFARRLARLSDEHDAEGDPRFAAACAIARFAVARGGVRPDEI